MATYAVVASYIEYANGTVDFPERKTWGDVDEWFVKWDCINIKFKGETEHQEFSLNSYGESDWKRPEEVEIWPTDEDGVADYDNNTLATTRG